MHIYGRIHSLIPAIVIYQLELISNWDTPNIIGIIKVIELCLNMQLSKHISCIADTYDTVYIVTDLHNGII